MSWKQDQKLLVKHQAGIMHGRMLIIDPSSGGGASQPGWALYVSGKLAASGILWVAEERVLHRRLRMISKMVEKLCTDFTPQIVVVEKIKRIRGVFSGASVDSLFKGIGAILAGISPESQLIEIPPTAWKKSESVDESYLKSDEMDAIYIGKFAVEETERMLKKKLISLVTPRKAPSNRKVDLAKTKPRRKVAKCKKISSTASQKSSKRGQSKSKRSKK